MRFNWIKGFFLKSFFFLYLGTNLYSVSVDYIFEISGGLNFYTEDRSATKARYNLDDLNKTTAGTFHIRNGVVLFDHLLFFLSYSYFERETYDYPTNYFVLNENSILEKSFHSLQFFTEYSFFKYSSKYNISWGIGGGWVRENNKFRTISQFSQITDLDNAPIGIPKKTHYDHGIFSTNIKFYYRLRRASTLFLALEYSLLTPSLEHFPNLVLGIDLNLEIIPSPPPQAPIIETIKKEKEIEEKELEKDNSAN